MITVEKIQTLIEQQLKSYDEQASGQVIEVKQLIRAQQVALIELQQAIANIESQKEVATTINFYTDSLKKIVNVINNADSTEANMLAADYSVQQAQFEGQVLTEDDATRYLSLLEKLGAKFDLQTALRCGQNLVSKN
ncbi:hypothetical protein ACU5DF_23400 [Aliivibrio wodanis]|uniref:hypothetical protein n=1 Tax=Aliivibrio wodanis TaxID=80852 RepID=UPI00406CE09D